MYYDPVADFKKWCNKSVHYINKDCKKHSLTSPVLLFVLLNLLIFTTEFMNDLRIKKIKIKKKK